MLLAADASLVSRAVEVACDDERADDDGAPAKPGDLADDALWAAAAAHARPPAYAKPLPYPAADAADDHDHDDGEMFFSSGNYGDHIFG